MSYSDHVVLNGQNIRIRRHGTDYTVASRALDVSRFDESQTLGADIQRVKAANPAAMEPCPDNEPDIYQSIYIDEDSGEELMFSIRVIVRLRQNIDVVPDQIRVEHGLDYERAMGFAHVLRLTSSSRYDVVETANRIAELPEVDSAQPDVVVQLEAFRDTLYSQQWYLHADDSVHPDVLPAADVDVPKA